MGLEQLPNFTEQISRFTLLDIDWHQPDRDQLRDRPLHLGSVPQRDLLSPTFYEKRFRNSNCQHSVRDDPRQIHLDFRSKKSDQNRHRLLGFFHQHCFNHQHTNLSNGFNKAVEKHNYKTPQYF